MRHKAATMKQNKGGVAVVIDVVRFSTTVCALLKAGRKTILAVETPERLKKIPGLDRADVFSELGFDAPGRRFDNSPFEALRLKSPNRKAYITTTTGTKALWACRGAERVFIGCFANFSAVLNRLKTEKRSIRFVPAALKESGMPEDELCAEAFQAALRGEKDTAKKALAWINASDRIGQFIKIRPQTGAEDLKLCLKLDCLPLMPEARWPNTTGASLFAKVRKA